MGPDFYSLGAGVMDPSQSGTDRRIALKGLFVGLIAGATLSRQSLAEDLLDPGAIKNFKPAAPLPSPVLPSIYNGMAAPGLPSPEQGRSNAASTVVTIKSLGDRCVELINEMERQGMRAKEEGALHDRLQAEYESYMREYRVGLFCSGCNQSKSQILAKGEPFPHPTQKIIRPTQNEIDAKDRELSKPVNDALLRMEDAQRKESDARDERDYTLEQIGHGANFWKTSFSLEMKCLDLQEQGAVAKYTAERQKATDQLVRLRATVKGAGSAGATSLPSNVQREIAMWSEMIKDLDAARESENRAYKISLYKAQRSAANEKDLINTYLNRERLREVLSLAVDSRMISSMAGFNTLGGLFTMGMYGRKDRDRLNPSVAGFVKVYASLPDMPPVSGASNPFSTPIPAQESPTKALDPLMRKIMKKLECDRSVDALCPTMKNSTSNGTRG